MSRYYKILPYYEVLMHAFNAPFSLVEKCIFCLSQGGSLLCSIPNDVVES